MKTRSVNVITIIVSVFASFVVGLCVSVAAVAPLIIIVTLAAAASLVSEGRVAHPFTAVKLYTQKAE